MIHLLTFTDLRLQLDPSSINAVMMRAVIPRSTGLQGFEPQWRLANGGEIVEEGGGKMEEERKETSAIHRPHDQICCILDSSALFAT